MAKYLIGISAGLVSAAVMTALILRVATGHAHLGDLVIVTVITLISGQLSLLPLWLLRKSSPIALFQAAFGGTILHLFLTLAVGATFYALRLVGDQRFFLFLLLGFYWFSLIFVVTVMIKIFRRFVAAQPAAAPDIPIQTKTS